MIQLRVQYTNIIFYPCLGQGIKLSISFLVTQLFKRIVGIIYEHFLQLIIVVLSCNTQRKMFPGKLSE